jgi:hypothetical protein
VCAQETSKNEVEGCENTTTIGCNARKTNKTYDRRYVKGVRKITKVMSADSQCLDLPNTQQEC